MCEGWKSNMGCFLLKELFLSFTFSLYWFCIFFRICLLPHFHGFIFILFILLRKKNKHNFCMISLWNTKQRHLRENTPQSFLHYKIFSLFTFKVWLQPFRKSLTSKISIDSQDEHIFQNFFNVFIYLQILHESTKKQPSFYLIDTNMNMKKEQINHHSEMLKINISFPNELNIISN